MQGYHLLILAGSLLIILFLVLIFRKLLKVFLVGLIYGFYSYRYLHIFKKYYIRSPYQYCFRDEFISHLIYILSKKDEIPCYKSKKDISFEDTPYFTNYKDFIKRKGNPYCFNAFHFDYSNFEIKALGYQEKIAGSMAIIVFYFMNDSFFMGEYIFRKPKTDVKANLTEHFLMKNDVEEDNFYIENSKNRIVHFQNTGFSIDIKYLNREDSGVIKNLQDYYNYIKGKKLVVES